MKERDMQTTIRIALALTLLAVLFLGFWIRTYPDRLSITDKWAEERINSNIKQGILEEINKQYPFLPDNQKEELVNKELKKFYDEHSEEIREETKKLSNYYKSRMKLEYPNGTTTYLLAIDPYTFYRLTKNYLDHGHAGDMQINGVWYNTLRFAPKGLPISTPFHVHVEAFWYRIMSFFHPGIGLMHALFYLPVALSLLIIAIAYVVGLLLFWKPKKIDVAILGAFILSFILAIHPAFFGRITGGFADTDAYNLLFPITIFLFLLLGMKEKKTLLRYVYAILAAITTWIYSFAWGNWWHFFDILIVGFLGIIAIETFLFLKYKKSNIKRIAGIFLTFLIIVSLLSIPGGKIKVVFGAIPSALEAIKGFKAPVKENLWPNVYTTVAELNPASIKSIIGQMSMGYNIMFLLSLMGIGLMFIKPKMKKRDYIMISILFIVSLILTTKITNIISWIIIFVLCIGGLIINRILDEKKIGFREYSAILVAVWFVATLYTTTKGVRFTLLMVIPFSLGFTFFIIWLYETIIANREWYKGIKQIYIKSLYILLVVLLLINPLNNAVRGAEQEIPSMNDAWYNSLTFIKQNTTKDAIITSWWDFGHWFKAIAERRVTFDGASQNTPQAHWVGHILQTSDEEEAIGILRMLDCSANDAFETLNKEINDTTKTISYLYMIFKENKSEAVKALIEKNISYATAEKVVNLTHCEPPEAIFITSQDMVGKAPVWAHFGLWNFTKAKYVNIVKSYRREKAIEKLEEMGLTKDEALKTYYEIKALPDNERVNAWVSPWPTYSMDHTIKCGKPTGINEVINCTLGLGIARTNEGIIVLRGIKTSLKHPENTSLTIEVYDSKNNLLGRNIDKPKVLYIVKNETIEKYELNGTFGLGMTIDDEGNILFSDPLLSGSLFTRLFFFNGKGTKYFEKIHDETSFTGQRIIVWRVKW